MASIELFNERINAAEAILNAVQHKHAAMKQAADEMTWITDATAAYMQALADVAELITTQIELAKAVEEAAAS